MAGPVHSQEQDQMVHYQGHPHILVGQYHVTPVQSKANIALLAKGFLKGALEEENFEKLELCMGDLGGFGGDIFKAIGDFEKKDIPDAIAALKLIGDGMGELEHSLQTCTQVKDDVAQLKVMIARFKHPKEELMHIFADLKKHNVHILQAISLARESLHIHKYEQAGVEIGEAVAMTTLGAQGPIKDVTKMAHIIKGVISAFGGEETLEDIFVCLAVQKEAVGIIGGGVALMKSGLASKNYNDVLNAVITIFMGLRIAEGAIPVCTGTFPTATWDYEGLVAATDKLSSGIKVSGKDVVIHGISILKDTVKAVKDYESGDYVAFGKDLADILKLVSKKDEPQYNETDMAKVMQGIINSFGGKMTLEDVLVCLGTEGAAAKSLELSLKNLKKSLKEKDFDGITMYALNVFLAIKTAEGAIPLCTGRFPTSTWDYKGLVDATDKINSSIKVSGKDVVIHGISILKDIVQAEYQYGRADFVGFGGVLGNILHLMTHNLPKDESLFLY